MSDSEKKVKDNWFEPRDATFALKQRVPLLEQQQKANGTFIGYTNGFAKLNCDFQECLAVLVLLDLLLIWLWLKYGVLNFLEG